MKYKSIFHYAQLGGVVCEMMAGSYFSKSPLNSAITMILILIFMPVIMLFLAFVIFLFLQIMGM